MMIGPMGACHVTEIPVDILNRPASKVLQFSYTLPTSKNNAIREPPPLVNGVGIAKTGKSFFAIKNYCVDKSPDSYSGHLSSDGLRLTFVQAGDCYNNKYPCSAYPDNNRLPCVVCTKY